MIFYFSGTGNSYYAAQYLAEKQNVQLVSIAECIRKKRVIFVPEDGEPVGFVYPVHDWGPPAAVLKFVDRLQLARKNNYIFAIATCGKSIGDSNDVLRDTMMANRIPLNAEFSLTMPTGQVTRSKVPPPSSVERILDRADEQLAHINEMISKRRSALESKKGRFSFIKTRIINLLFLKFFRPSKFFRVEKACNGCGYCAKACPMQNIGIENGRPVWGRHCESCLACLHLCPNHAIELGTLTLNKGRYYNPRVKKPKK